MTQATLFGFFDAVPIDPTLVCAFGEPWMGPHPLCRAESDRNCLAFDAAVARGEFNERGYTPREWAARLKAGRT